MNNDILYLSTEQFNDISQGMNIRQELRKYEKDEFQVRLQSSIMLYLYRVLPNGKTSDELHDLLNVDRWDLLNDEEFEEIVKSEVALKLICN